MRFLCRRNLVAVLAALVVSTGGAIALAARASAASDRDSVVGGVIDAFSASVALSAHSGPSGEDPYGRVDATVPPSVSPAATIQLRLHVTCLAVAGNLAAIGGVVTDSSASDLPPGFPFVVVLRDGGASGGDGDGVMPLPARPASSCGAFVALAATAPSITSGNVLIHDASP